MPAVSSGGELWLPRIVLAAMEQEATRCAPDETGGVLMGYWARSPVLPLAARAGATERAGDDGGMGEIVVVAQIGPGPAAAHSRCAFTPDHEYQDREIASLYDASGRRWSYLGDWHTHPEGSARLSARDERTLRRIADEPQARAPNPVMLVLAGGAPWVPRAWVAVVRSHGWWWRSRLVEASLDIRLHD